MYQHARKRRRSHASPVTVLHPRYFVPRFDPRTRDDYKRQCPRQHAEQRHQHKYDICRRLLATDYSNDVSCESFVDHLWAHVASPPPQLRRQHNNNSSSSSSGTQTDDVFNVYEAFPRSKPGSALVRC